MLSSIFVLWRKRIMEEEKMNDFMFNLSCMEEHEMRESGDWIYFIHHQELSDKGDGTIWQIRRDGTDMKKIQKSNLQVRGIIGIRNNWIYFVTKESKDASGLHGVILGGCHNYFKMTLIGGLERPMTMADYNDWEEEIEEIEENT